ncbi:5'-3' exonuclease [Mycoplasma seminis]|uniref:5'-3' exonuclease n=1 Tax=Mycoplasma seminis TaxID=512749 RepID=A0ABY9HBL0_9MOLU|nr:5'-3' exonuclease [Mycoplasma seminis]WLP85954.1 5'-3' exonuclease [Mycoplasma seminis]
MNKKEKHLLIDGNYLMFQSFYATYYGNPTNIMRSSKGVPTNGINLFLHQLIKLIDFYNPTHLYIAFDSPKKSFRHDIYQDYKAGRTKAPEELFVQFNLVKEILKSLNVNFQEMPGFEADDLIAAYCKQVADDQFKIIFSRDKDLQQLIDQNTAIIQKDSNNYSLLTLDNYFQIYGFLPSQVIDYKALAGDSSDNLPGVKGIGDKTAVSLIQKYGSVPNLYQNEANWSNDLTKSVITKLQNGKQDALFCLQMATLNPNVTDFDTNKDDYVIDLDIENAIMQLEDLELRFVLAKLKELIW